MNKAITDFWHGPNDTSEVCHLSFRDYLKLCLNVISSFLLSEAAVLKCSVKIEFFKFFRKSPLNKVAPLYQNLLLFFLRCQKNEDRFDYFYSCLCCLRCLFHFVDTLAHIMGFSIKL